MGGRGDTNTEREEALSWLSFNAELVNADTASVCGLKSE